MKRTLWIITAGVLIFAGQAFGQKAGPERNIDFQRYDGYFERNDSGLKGETSYLAFTSQAQFDKIFHAAPTGGENNFLPENVFKRRVVIAAVARGNFIRAYDDLKVTAKNGKIYVRYRALDKKQESAAFASPLLLAVNRGRYSQVIFIQDGQRVGAVSIPVTR